MPIPHPRSPRSGRRTSALAPGLRIRAATPAHLTAINEVTLAAKAHWGYPAGQLAVWRDSLLTTAASLATRPTRVALAGPSLVGVAQLDPSVEPWELVACWVAPAHMRRGIGTALLCAIAAEAACAGQGVIHIDADPHAEPFYQAMGAVRVGSVPAPIPGEPGRERPQLRLPTLVGMPAGR